MGWMIFLLGWAALITGVYAGTGHWICLAIAVIWYLGLHEAAAKNRRKQELLARLKEITGDP